jgi:hypothetical protein
MNTFSTPSNKEAELLAKMGTSQSHVPWYYDDEFLKLLDDCRDKRMPTKFEYKGRTIHVKLSMDKRDFIYWTRTPTGRGPGRVPVDPERRLANAG